MNDETRGIEVPTAEQEATIAAAKRDFGEAAITWHEVGPNSVAAIVIELHEADETIAATRVLPGGMTSTAGAWVNADAQLPTLDDIAREAVGS